MLFTTGVYTSGQNSLSHHAHRLFISFLCPCSHFLIKIKNLIPPSSRSHSKSWRIFWLHFSSQTHSTLAQAIKISPLYNLKNLFFNKKFKYHCDCTTQKWLHGGQALKQGNKLEGSCSCLVERFWWLGLRWSESVKRNVIRKFFMTYCGTLKKEE